MLETARRKRLLKSWDRPKNVHLLTKAVKGFIKRVTCCCAACVISHTGASDSYITFKTFRGRWMETLTPLFSMFILFNQLGCKYWGKWLRILITNIYFSCHLERISQIWLPRTLAWSVQWMSCGMNRKPKSISWLSSYRDHMTHCSVSQTRSYGCVPRLRTLARWKGSSGVDRKACFPPAVWFLSHHYFSF